MRTSATAARNWQGGARAAGASSVTPTEKSDFSRLSVAVACGIIATVSNRVHELVPGMAFLHPAILFSSVAAIAVFPQAGPARLQLMWQNKHFRSLLHYFLWAAAMVPFALWRGGAFDTVTGIFLPTFVLFGCVLLADRTEANLRAMQRAFVVSALIHLVGLKAMGDGFMGRLGGTSLDPNDLAALANIAAMLAFGLALTSKTTLQKVGWLVATGVLVAGVMWTGSRGGALAFGVGVTTLILLQPGKRRGTIILATAVAIPLVWAIAPQSYRDRITGIGSLESDYNNTDFWGRKAIWRRARIYISRNPISGVGVRGFETADGMYMKEIGMTGKWSAPHNAYVQSTTELGVPGGALFLLILLTAGRTALRLARVKRGTTGLTDQRPEFIAAMTSFAGGAYFLSHAYFVPAFAVVAMIGFADGVANRSTGTEGPTPGRMPQRPASGPAWGTPGWRSRRYAAAFERRPT